MNNGTFSFKYIEAHATKRVHHVRFQIRVNVPLEKRYNKDFEIEWDMKERCIWQVYALRL